MCQRLEFPLGECFGNGKPKFNITGGIRFQIRKKESGFIEVFADLSG